MYARSPATGGSKVSLCTISYIMMTILQRALAMVNNWHDGVQ
jgi:hypothetical protein